MIINISGSCSCMLEASDLTLSITTQIVCVNVSDNKTQLDNNKLLTWIVVTEICLTSRQKSKKKNMIWSTATFNEFKVARPWLTRQDITIVVKHTRTDNNATSYKRSLIYPSHIVPISIYLTCAENFTIVFAAEKATLCLAFCDFRSRRDNTHTVLIGSAWNNNGSKG